MSNQENRVEIKPRKWYYRMMGYGGCDSRHVAAVRMTGETAGGANMFSMFGNRNGEVMRPLPAVPVWEAIDEEGRTYKIDANDLEAVGIGSLREAFDHAPDLTDERLEELREAGRQLAERERQEAERAKREHEAAVAECRREYAYLPHRGEYLRVAQVAANLRVELKRKFPGVKFSVTSKRFSGGNSIDVDWEDGPSHDEVEKVAGKYQHSHADAESGDYWDYDPSAFNEVFGGTKFLHCQRSMSDATEATLYAGIGTKWSRETDAERQRIFRAFQNTALPVGAVVTGIDGDGQGVAFAEPATPEDRGTVFGIAATVSENRERNGIEIRFPSRPGDDVLASLKENGWRWSRFSKCWYNRASDEARTFAESIAAAV
jgi:hypothetical protein